MKKNILIFSLGVSCLLSIEVQAWPLQYRNVLKAGEFCSYVTVYSLFLYFVSYIFPDSDTPFVLNSITNTDEVYDLIYNERKIAACNNRHIGLDYSSIKSIWCVLSLFAIYKLYSRVFRNNHYENDDRLLHSYENLRENAISVTENISQTTLSQGITAEQAAQLYSAQIELQKLGPAERQVVEVAGSQEIRPFFFTKQTMVDLHRCESLCKAGYLINPLTRYPLHNDERTLAASWTHWKNRISLAQFEAGLYESDGIALAEAFTISWNHAIDFCISLGLPREQIKQIIQLFPGTYIELVDFLRKLHELHSELPIKEKP